MKKLIIASLLGGLTLFVWGGISWMALPFHNENLRELPNEAAVVAALQSSNATTGTYRIPGTGPGSMDKMKVGPIAMIQYHAEGVEPGPMYFLKGLLVEILAMCIAVMMLSKISWSLASYANRVKFMMMIGLLLAVAGRLSDWAYMGNSAEFTILFALDDIIGWTLAGLVVAKFTKPNLAKA
jgi:hypothetical protein